jgi:uncharacterized protein (AIM24 family)
MNAHEIDYKIEGEEMQFVQIELDPDEAVVAELAFVHAGGTAVKRTLERGEKLRIDTGCIVACTKDISYDVEFVGGIKNTIFGGDGLFYASQTGSGDLWIQSLPFSGLAGRVIAAAQGFGSQKKGEGSVLAG